jgi:predicted small lipoprotein YifL
MRFALAVSLLALAACGADGPPVAPSAKPVASGITISGTARVGVVYEG